jgi:signal transduction histidine kinase
VQAARSRYPDAEFGYDREVEPAPVMADDLLSRAVSNLLANAVEHNDSDVPSVEVRVDVDGPAVRISVADNGPGIPDAEIDSVFDPSERGLESDGEGLGLFLVASIVRQYDGRVDVADTATGTCFTITLPRATVDAEVRVEAAEKDGFLPTPRLLPVDGRAALD